MSHLRQPARKLGVVQFALRLDPVFFGGIRRTTFVDPNLVGAFRDLLGRDRSGRCRRRFVVALAHGRIVFFIYGRRGFGFAVLIKVWHQPLDRMATDYVSDGIEETQLLGISAYASR